MSWLDHERIFNMIAIITVIMLFLLIIYGLPVLLKLAFNYDWQKGAEVFK